MNIAYQIDQLRNLLTTREQRNALAALEQTIKNEGIKIEVERPESIQLEIPYPEYKQLTVTDVFGSI